MTDINEADADAQTDEQESDEGVNISRLREAAIRGDNFRDCIEDFTYYGYTGDLYYGPLNDLKFLPIAALLEERLGIDRDEAKEMLEEEKDPDTGKIDASNFDEDFIKIMAEVAVKGVDTTQGFAKGEDREGLRQIFGISEDEESNIGLQGGKTLIVAEKVLNISSDAEKAEKFRRDGGRK